MTSIQTPKRYEFETADGYAIVSLLPTLNESQWGEIEQAGNEILEQLDLRPGQPLLVDLTPLDFMGSSLVALIIRLWKAAGERNAKMVVINDDDMVYEVLKLAGLTKVWTIAETRDEAVRQVSKGRKGKPAAKRSSESAGAGAGGSEPSSPIWPALGILAVIAAAVGVILRPHAALAIDPPQLMDDQLQQQVGLSLELGCSVLAILAGIVAARRHNGAWRVVSVLVLVAGLGIGVFGAMNWPN